MVEITWDELFNAIAITYPCAKLPSLTIAFGLVNSLANNFVAFVEDN